MQRLNHHHLYVFWVFSKHVSFTKASFDLSIAQSAVTSQVKQLEESLNLVLINRSNPRRPELTEEGRKVAEYAESIFESSRELINWATNGTLPKNRVVRIGAISGLSRNFQYEFVEPLLWQKNFKFEVTSGDQQNLLRLLSEHSLDVVLTSRNANPDYNINFYSNVLKSSPLVFVIKNEKKYLKISDLKDIFKSNSLFVPGKQFESKSELEAFLEPYQKVQIAGEIDDTALLRVLAVRSGHVVAIPEMGIINEINSKEVIVLHKLNKVEQKYYAITRQRRDPNSDVRYLIDSCKGKLGRKAQLNYLSN